MRSFGGPSSTLLAATVVLAGLDATGAVTCLAQGTMYACQSSREFYSINLATGAKTLLGSISAGVSISASLAHDCQTQTTYVSSTGGNAGLSRNIYTLNVGTRQAVLVGPYGDSAILMHAIEIDHRTGILYGVSIHNHGLYSISRSTGAATLIGLTGIAVGVTTFDSLGYDSDQGVMYLTNTGTDSLYRVNLLTGSATLVGPLNGPVSIGALAYNVDNHTMYLVDNDGDVLYTVNPATGAATPVGSTGVGNLIGLVYVTPTCPPPPTCPADFNGDGALNSQDFFEFLAAFFAGAPAADFNADGMIGSQDFFDYLAAFFAGCG